MRASPGSAGLKAVDKDTTAGVLFGIGAYGLWGLLPLYFFVLAPAGAVEIVANRVVWSLLFCTLLITITRSCPDSSRIVNLLPTRSLPVRSRESSRTTSWPPAKPISPAGSPADAA